MMSEPNEHDPGQAPAPGDGSRTQLPVAQAVRQALDQFAALTGRQPEGASGVRRSGEGGWSVLVEVVELERIPSSTSVMATYRVDVDTQGELMSYERLRRYSRGATDET
jgi:hypothetical protein